MRYLFGLLLLLHTSVPALAQLDPQLSQYMFNQFYFNPAFTGINQVMQASFSFRSQWTGYNPTFDNGGSPTTQVLTFHSSIPRFKSGLGFLVVNDNLGPWRNLSLQLSYAYHVELSKNQKLSLGMRGGMQSVVIEDQFRFIDQNDPVIPLGRESQLRPDFSVGLSYTNRDFWLSVSANHLIEPSFNFGITESTGNTFLRSYYLMGGYNYELNDLFTVTPTFFIKSDLKEYSLEGGAVLTYNQKFWFGLTYRHEESANALIGVNLVRKNKHLINLGYSFDYVFRGQTAKQPTSHEVVLSYTIPVKDVVYPANIRTPRHRIL